MNRINRFVIITSQRTGSNMLVSALRSHPQVSCYGELFRKNKRAYKGAVKVIASLDTRFHQESVQHAQWREFLEAVFASDKTSRTGGFKLMLNQNRDVRESLIKDKSYKKIFLKRENVIAVFSSEKIAKLTGQGSAGRFAKVKTAQVEFSPEEFELYWNKYDAKYEQASKELSESDQEYFSTTYSRICKREGIDEIYRFLGIDETLPWNIPTKKRNSSKIIERFTNPQAVHQYLSRVGRAQWIEED